MHSRFFSLLLLYFCEGTKHKSINSAVNLILKSYHTNFITIYNPSAYLGVDIVGNIKLTSQAITVVNNFTYLPLRCKNGPCSAKRRSHFGKVLIFFPDSTHSIDSYYGRLKKNRNGEESPVSIFILYFDGTKFLEHDGGSRYTIMDILYASVFIAMVDNDWVPEIRSNTNKITIYCTNCIYCGGKIPESIVPFQSTTDDLKTKLRQALSLGFDNGNGMMWMLRTMFNPHEESLEKAFQYFATVLEQ